MRRTHEQHLILLLGSLLAAVAAFVPAAPAWAAPPAIITYLIRLVPVDVWIVIGVIVGSIALYFICRKPDCKCRCGIHCKCKCNCSASCPCQVPPSKLLR